MPPEGVARCRAAWARLAGRRTCVVHGNPNNPGNVRITADRVALIDWDESHVDVPDLDLVLPHNAAGLDHGTHDIAAQASAAWEAAVCWDDEYAVRRSPKFEQCEKKRTIDCPSRVTKELEPMDIKRSGSQPSMRGPADWFTGTVRIDPLYDAPEPARVSCANVTFEPGARTAWHTHPLGQTLIVTMGCGWVQEWGGPIEEIRPGDVIRCPPGKKHWHGATPTTAMTHVAIQEKLDGKAVEWMEKVTDAQYDK